MKGMVSEKVRVKKRGGQGVVTSETKGMVCEKVMKVKKRGGQGVVASDNEGNGF